MSYQFKLANDSLEIAAYFALRRSIFAEEQQLFPDDDRDDIDQYAYPIVALTTDTRQVVGVVRIYEVEPRIWYGGRLGTHRDYRKGWQIGKGLIEKAVTTANTWGCTQFLATVQLQNVRFFQRLHWQSLKEITICNQPHHLMEADLDFYPPSNELINYSFSFNGYHPNFPKLFSHQELEKQFELPEKYREINQ